MSRPGLLALLGAAGAIVVARMWLRVSPASVVRWATRREPGNDSTNDISRSPSVRAVIAVGSRTPFDATCLEQSIALVMLLAMRNVPARVVVGVARASVDLRAHAWVESNGVVVLGGAQASDFAPLPAVAR